LIAAHIHTSFQISTLLSRLFSPDAAITLFRLSLALYAIDMPLLPPAAITYDVAGYYYAID